MFLKMPSLWEVSRGKPPQKLRDTHLICSLMSLASTGRREQLTSITRRDARAALRILTRDGERSGSAGAGADGGERVFMSLNGKLRPDVDRRSLHPKF